MRYFIGLSIPDPISIHIGSLRGSMPSVQWYDPNTYHISLCYIGEIKSNMLINDLDLALEKINLQSFELSIQGVSHYTSPTYENRFFTTIMPSPALLHLKKKVEYIKQQLNIKSKKKHFIPHISIAKGIGISEEQISNWLYKYNLFKTEPFQICQFSLYNFYHSKDESYYDIVSNYLLR